MDRCWKVSKAKGGDLLVLLALADYADQHGEAWPSVKSVARKVRMAERTVQRAFRRLASLGEITIRVSGGSHGANLYRVILPDEGGDKMSGVTNCRGDNWDREGVTPASPNPSEETVIKKNIYTPSGDILSPPEEAAHTSLSCTQQPANTLRSQDSPLNGQQTEFEIFWQAYPRKRAKGDAARAWAKIRPDAQLRAEILAAIERAKTSADWATENGQFIPYPAKWLKTRGWEDELPASLALRGKPVPQSCAWRVQQGVKTVPCGKDLAPNQPRPFCPEHLKAREDLDRKMEEAKRSGGNMNSNAPQRRRVVL